MTLGSVLAVGGALLALIIGIWAGLPGKHRKTPEEIEREIQRAMLTGVTRRASRNVPSTPFGWLRRKPGSGRAAASARRFHVEFPEEPGRSEPETGAKPPDRPVS